MSMDKNMKYQMGQQFKRNNEVEVSSEFKQKVELIALAHLATGNSADYMLAMNSLAKTQARTEIEELKGIVQSLVTSLAPTKEEQEISRAKGSVKAPLYGIIIVSCKLIDDVMPIVILSNHLDNYMQAYTQEYINTLTLNNQ